MGELQAESGFQLPEMPVQETTTEGEGKGKVNDKEDKDDADANKDNNEPVAAAKAESVDDQHSKMHQAFLQGFVATAFVSCKGSETLETWRNVSCNNVVFGGGIVFSVCVYMCLLYPFGYACIVQDCRGD